MCAYDDRKGKLNINTLTEEESQRYLNPDDIILPPGYKIEVFLTGLDAPGSFTFDEFGNLLIAESGLVSGVTRIIRYRNGNFETVAEGFVTPITGVTYYKGNIYVSHKGIISVINANGNRQDIITGLPSNGDYGNSNVDFDLNGKMYFGQGTVTNSGVVGTDNLWVSERPFLHDTPGSYIILRGQNFSTRNMMVYGDELAFTGAYSPYGQPNKEFEMRKGVLRASGSILRANIDGTGLELVSWGLRYPSHIRFDHSYRLFVSNQGFEDRGSRPIVNAPDEFLMIKGGEWYGWPDFAGGEPVTSQRFQPEGKRPVEFLLTNHPSEPSRPYAMFPPYSNITGFDFCYSNFGIYGNIYIAEYGPASHFVDGDITPYAGFGHRISIIDKDTGGVTTFAINRSGFSSSITREGGFARPIDVIFGPDGALYVLDLGINPAENPNIYLPNTGVVWRIQHI